MHLGWFGLLAIAVATSAPVLHSESASGRLEPAVEHFISQDGAGPSTYRAFRRLDAEGLGHKGWLEAWTELRGGTFEYDVVGQGGSDAVLTRVLRPVLQQEQEAWRNGEARRAFLTAANYEFEPAADQSGDLLKVFVKPRRKGRLMLEGSMLLARDAASLVRVEGRLVSNPSFWIKRVDVTRQYARVNGLSVPVVVDSTASFRFFGSQATFRMTYDYVQINGLPVVRNAGGRASASTYPQ